MAKKFNPARTAFSAIFLLVLFGYMLARKPPSEAHPKFTGTTFGSVTFHIYTANADLDRVEKARLGLAISKELDTVNHQMSTWRDDSEISRFNRTNSTDWIEISTNFAKVVQAARLFAEDTDGAFDPTAGVLKRQYELGPAGAPVPERLEAGYTLLEQDGTRIRKTNPALAFNLDAIAKGYAVDQVSELLTQQGVTNYLVEIGGEMRTSGLNPDGGSWFVGIEVPKVGGGLYGYYRIPDIAVATSGTAYQGKHIIDPATGASVSNTLRGVSVLAPSCIEADALATAYVVMGRERAFAHAAARPETEVLLLYVRDGVLQEQKTDGWPDEEEEN